MLGSSSTRCTGIHVSGDALHAVELVRSGRRIAVERCLSVRLEEPVPMPEGLADDGSRASLVRAVRTLRRSGLSGERPYFGLAGPAAFVKRRVRLPDDLDGSHEHLRWEARQFLEDDYDDYVVDTLVTPRHGFVIAARRQLLELYGVLCREARLAAPRFDMEPFALCNALEATGAGGTGFEIVLHATATGTRAVLLCDGDYEADVTSTDAIEAVVAALECLCTSALGEEPAARLWVAGDGAGLPPTLLSRFADSVDDLNPFAGLPMADGVRGQFDSDPSRTRIYAVAAGLAFRGLADA